MADESQTPGQPGDTNFELSKDSVYVHPDTGEEVEIPEGSEVERNEKGEILYWRNPPAITGPHPDQVPGYEPKFDRAGTHRRILAHVTDEVDVTKTEANAQRFLVPVEALGQRNTVEALAIATARDTNTPGVPANYEEARRTVSILIEALTKAGLVEQREDGTYALTDAGRTELAN